MPDGLRGLLGIIVVGVVAYVGLRALQAKHEGGDPAKAAADALRDVGPPAIAAAGGLVLAFVIAGFAGLLFLFALIDIFFRRGDGDALVGMVFLLVLSGVVLVGTVVGGAWLAISRGRRRSER
ncbi:MAG: hypothetical protein ACR2MO_12330 [Acidimicrobiales bacterium]